LPTIEYEPGALVRKVQVSGEIWLHGCAYRIAPAFYGYPVALRPTAQAQVLDVYFLRHRVAQITVPRPEP
jgi:hypothetical protein